jgi:cysteinyl-tRNA synthetase
VGGAGTITILSSGDEQIVKSGDSVPLGALRSAANEPPAIAHDATIQAFRRALDPENDPAGALGYLHGLMDHLARIPHDPASQQRTLLMIREMTATLAVWLEHQQSVPPAATDTGDQWVALLLDLRQKLRASKQFALADAVRDALTEKGITVGDAKAG